MKIVIVDNFAKYAQKHIKKKAKKEPKKEQFVVGQTIDTQDQRGELKSRSAS